MQASFVLDSSEHDYSFIDKLKVMFHNLSKQRGSYAYNKTRNGRQCLCAHNVFAQKSQI
jgi:hypothetical protein